NFLSLETDEAVSFEIFPKKPFEKVEIRPRSLGITPKVKDGVISFTIPKNAYFTVEPYGRENALHIFADPLRRIGVRKGDGHLRYFEKGVHDVGVITLHDNETIFLEPGALVYGSVYAKDAKNIRIIGGGILDNSRNKEEILFPVEDSANDVAVKNATRRHTIVLEYCENVVVEGVTIRDSLVYTIRPSACKNLLIKNVKIIGNWRYNSDGIDMHNCQDVLIENCFLRTFDDSICAKGFDCYFEGDVEEEVNRAMYRDGKKYDEFKNLYVKDCVIWNDWGKALEIGAETRAKKMHGITFTDCDIIHVTGPVLDITNVDFAHIHNVIFQNINVEYDTPFLAPYLQKKDGEEYTNPDPKKAPMLITAETIFHKEYSAGGKKRGKISDITFRNIHLFGEKMPLIKFQGYNEDHKTENVRVENLFFNGEKITPFPKENLILGDFTENITLL
ncbi:MAG: right-handed parallel beta-helix repeat-containing protein, partial [Clostridia bacterium]|nr:right-handed parallel beta-helix repeat-containing protein [Clostridia bacterium]